jgi:cobalamin biosynthetic protein CobC
MLAHGGNLNDAVARYGIARADWLDLSTGINPVSYPSPILPADIWHRLPEASEALLDVARLYYRTPHLLAVAGTQAAIQALPRLRTRSTVAIVSPVYAEHAYRWRQAGHQVTEIDASELEQATDRFDVLVLCSPNNPTGAKYASKLLISIAGRLARRGGWLIVDEAFIDATPEESLLHAGTQRGLIVLRSVGKFFGLAGLRLGFVAAEADLLEVLADHIGPWSVTAATQLIGTQALGDTQWQTAMREQLILQGQRLYDLLSEFGIQASGTALFQWWQEECAEQFHEHMAQRGIWVRLFTQQTRGIRIGLPGSEDDWQRLRQALQEWTMRS